MAKRIQEHFNVPEGYFEQFAEQMMQQLPEQSFQPMRIARPRMLWYRYAAVAAMFVVVMVSSALLFFSKEYEKDVARQEQNASESLGNEFYTPDAAAEYAMIDHQDIYQMIVE